MVTNYVFNGYIPSYFSTFFPHKRALRFGYVRDEFASKLGTFFC